MNFPEDLKYAKSHEWVKTLEDGTVLVGVSDYAQDALGDLVFVNLPEAGDEVTEGRAVCRCGIRKGCIRCVFTGKRHSGRDQRGTVRRPGIHQRGAL